MKSRILSCIVLLLLVAPPLALSANPDTDRKIEAAAESSYNFRAILDGRVKAQASEGVVTLTGTVREEQEKTLAGDTVANLPGVTSVINEITVQPAHARRSDAWIAFKVRSRLLVKRNVSASTTTVTVHDGVVTLGGTAGSYAQKNLAGTCAGEVEGVKEVRNEIVLTSPAGKETLREKIDDASITAQVKFALLSHRPASGLKTKVVTHEGIVVITGEADSAEEKSLFTRLAEDVHGVQAVRNNMTVKP